MITEQTIKLEATLSVSTTTSKIRTGYKTKIMADIAKKGFVCPEYASNFDDTHALYKYEYSATATLLGFEIASTNRGYKTEELAIKAVLKMAKSALI